MWATLRGDGGVVFRSFVLPFAQAAPRPEAKALYLLRLHRRADGATQEVIHADTAWR
jgi:hypothetical protein